MNAAIAPAAAYTTVCRVEEIDCEGGVSALVGGRSVAVFRTYAGEVFALDNHDPYCGASVLARGLVGTLERDGDVIDFVASPMHKQRFDLRTGRSLEEDDVSVAAYSVRVVDGIVHIGGRQE